MIKIVISTAKMIILLFVSFLIYFGFFGPEQYYVFEPYIDTEMAEEYSPELFDKLKIGENKEKVLQMIGQPLNIYYDTLDNKITETYNYTNDGKIFYEEMPWYMFNDYAWYKSNISFNTKGEITSIYKGWIYD